MRKLSRPTIGKLIFVSTCLACAAFLGHVSDKKAKVVAQPPPCTFDVLCMGIQWSGVAILGTGTIKCQANGGEQSCGQYSVYLEAWNKPAGGTTWIYQGYFQVYCSNAMNCGDQQNFEAYIGSRGNGWDFPGTGLWEFYLGVVKTPCSTAYNDDNLIAVQGPLTYSNYLGGGDGPPVNDCN